MKKAVILLSGGLDSTTTLAAAKSDGYDCYCISFDYNQRLKSELEAAKKIAAQQGATEHRIVTIDISQFGGSALTDLSIPVPDEPQSGIPVTYVPARNTVFLSIALGFAEVIGARNIFYGANILDYSGYPDCRPEFLEAFEAVANLGTKAGVEGDKFQIHAPLMELTKAQIIELGHSLGIDYADTVSCYQADEAGRACGQCDSCHIRKQGFTQLSIADQTRYQ